MDLVRINGGAMVFMSGGPPPPPPPPGARATPANARWNWRRMSLLTNTLIGRAFNDGAKLAILLRRGKLLRRQQVMSHVAHAEAFEMRPDRSAFFPEVIDQ